MKRGDTQIGLSLLQLAQATYAVLEREVPESAGLPANGLAVLRFLRWHGEKTLPAIAAFLGVSSASMEETVTEMVRVGFIRTRAETSVPTGSVFELAPKGVEVAKTIITSQRDRIEQALSRLPDDCDDTAGVVLETLAYELVANSAGFGIMCAECWALDARECVKQSTADHCAFRKAKAADLSPDLSEGPDHCPSHCTACAHQFVALSLGPPGDP